MRGKNNSDQEQFRLWKMYRHNASELHNPAWRFFLTRI